MSSVRKYTFTISIVGALSVVGIYALLTTFFFETGLRRQWLSSTSVNLQQVQLLPVSDIEEQQHTYSNSPTSTDSNVSKMDVQRQKRNETGKTVAISKGVSETTHSPSTVPFKETSSVPVSSHCSWANFTVTGPPYFLTAVFIVRIYERDLSELTTAHIKQWLVYLRYAGVQHVYLYDLWYLPGESQREPLDVFIKEGYLTYVDKHELNPYVREKSQLPSYQHCIDEFGKDSVWQAAIDIDEYPFSAEDTRPGFMARFVDKYSSRNPDVSEITMQNFLYLGAKDKSKELLIDQLWRHTHGPSNALVKPVYKPAHIRGAQVHHNRLRMGKSKSAPSNGLRINHYWGARLQNWGPDTAESLAKTEEDRGMEPILAALRTCDHYIRPYL